MKNNKKDIGTEADIEVMVDTFYAKVNQDAELSYVFNDYSKIDWDSHLPKMYNFWKTLIFGVASYKGNPFAKHVGLPIHEAHFERWIGLFEETVDELFNGEIAENTKQRAKSIAFIFQRKLKHINA